MYLSGVWLARPMAWVVFLRGVNVGGARRFLPSTLARELTDLLVVSLGAAGTFVVRANVTESRLRKAFADRLSFETDLLICPGREIEELVGSEPFRKTPPGSKPYLTVLAAPGAETLRLPYEVPPGPNWEMRVLHVRGRYVLSVCRRLTAHLTYPNPVLEKALHVGATTRGWPTVVAIDQLLKSP
jgi:uncharacterized protein (DUF1697 family)